MMNRPIRGFTLVEMVVVIAITGIVASMVAMFGRRQVEAYIDAGNRAELADAADTALRRIARDLRGALPNSVRQSGNFLEFVPIHDGGRYRADVDATAGGDFLNLASTTDNSFDVFGPAVTIVAGDQLVIFNLGLPGSDVYEGTSRRAISTGAGSVTNIQYTLGAAPNQQFPLGSPLRRFHVVGTPFTYECNANAVTPALGTVIMRWGYGFSAAAPSAPWGLGGASSVVVNNVTFCNFSYTPGVLQRNGIVSLELTLTRNNESVNLLHQVEIANTP